MIIFSKAEFPLGKVALLCVIILGSLSPIYSHGNENFQKIEFEDISFDSYCFPFHFYVNVPKYRQTAGEKYVPNELIINSEKEFSELLKIRRGAEGVQCKDDGSTYGDRFCKMEQECLKKNISPIDFLKYTVLGKWMTAGCNVLEINKKVLMDRFRQKIIYDIDVETSDIRCNGPGISDMKLITIPKIPPGYTVEFNPSFEEKKKVMTFYDPDGDHWIIRNWEGEIIERRPRKKPKLLKISEDERKMFKKLGIGIRDFKDE